MITSTARRSGSGRVAHASTTRARPEPARVGNSRDSLDAFQEYHAGIGEGDPLVAGVSGLSPGRTSAAGFRRTPA